MTENGNQSNRLRGLAAKQPTTPGDDWAAIGVIANIFGIHGDLKVHPLTDFPDRFARTEAVYLGGSMRRYPVTSARLHKTMVVLHLAGVETANDAEALRGKTLYIPASELLPLPADQYYHHDLVGLRVVHVNGRELGIVSNMLSAGANDLFVVRDAQTGAETLLPAVKDFIRSVDIPGGVITVDPIPGLFDDAAVFADGPDDDSGEDDADRAFAE